MVIGEKIRRVLGHKVEGQGHSITMYGEISTLGGIFLPVFRTYGHTIMELMAVIHYWVHITTHRYHPHHSSQVLWSYRTC